MSERPVILSCFPGIDGLGLGFAEVFPDACIVRGPDLIFGRLHDVRAFHAARGVFWGILAGTPCQAFSRLVHIVKAKGQTPAPNLIPELERIVGEGRPDWFVMENVAQAPEPVVDGYVVRSTVYNNRWAPDAPEQNRERRFSFGTRDGRALVPDVGAFENPAWERAVVATSSKEGALAKSQQELRDGISPRLKRAASALPGQMPRRSIERCCELQGWPADLLDGTPFTASGKYRMIGNAVPRWTAVAIATAVKRALAGEVGR